jgi:hypothetical protein
MDEIVVLLYLHRDHVQSWILMLLHHIVSNLPKITIFQGSCESWLGVGVKCAVLYKSHFNLRQKVTFYYNS